MYNRGTASGTEVTAVARNVGLDMSAIVSAALGIADTEGVEKLTMRRLSAALDVTPMSIYHHIGGGKEQLLDLVVDQSLSALPVIDADADADEQIRRVFLGMHRLLVEHPSLAHAIAVRPLEGPVAMRTADGVLAALHRAGFDEHAAVTTFVSLFSFTLGASLYRITRRTAGNGRSFPQASEQETPAVYRVRHSLTETSSDDQFLSDLAGLLASRPRRASTVPPTER